MPKISYDPNADIPKVELEESISRIGLRNILDVISHVVMRSDDLTVHKIEMRNGGKVELSYAQDGQLKNFKTEKCAIQLTDSKEDGGVDILLDMLVEEQ